jgi:SAM-dependent methyltransferase
VAQRTGATFLAQTDFYEKQYSFYERPGAALFDRQRYAAMANWIRASLPSTPTTILDAGCGRGWMLEAMAAVFPGAKFSGIEPSEAESDNARRLGFDVMTSRIAPSMKTRERYDLVYSTNVLEHTDSPADFLTGLGSLLTPEGRIVITCPDGSTPGAELMFSDQNFSLLPVHLVRLATRSGLEVARWSGPPPDVSLRDKQLVVLRRATGDPVTATGISSPDMASLHRKRCDYLDAWRSCAEKLRSECAQARRVYNFGTSTWSFLLAGYCPQYWELVTAAMIDGISGEFLGKPVLDAGRVDLKDGDAVVLGVDPEKQKKLSERFRDSPARVITWNGIVTR